MKNLKQFIKTTIREFLNENFNDKYSNFKKNWIKDNSIGDLEIPKPFYINTYVFGYDENDRATGYLVEMYYESKLIGTFHCFYNFNDSYEGADGVINDVELVENFRHKGFGKILTLKSIDVSNSLNGFYESDTRGVEPSQIKVYNSLKKNNIIDDYYRINYDLAQKLINNVVNDFILDVN